MSCLVDRVTKGHHRREEKLMQIALSFLLLFFSVFLKEKKTLEKLFKKQQQEQLSRPTNFLMLNFLHNKEIWIEMNSLIMRRGNFNFSTQFSFRFTFTRIKNVFGFEEIMQLI